MRQAIVDLDADLLAERGFEFDLFREVGVVDTEVLSCEGPRGVLRVRVEERLDPERLEEMDAIEWWERASGDEGEHVYLLEAGTVDARETPGADTVEATDGGTTDADAAGQFPRCEQLRVTDRGLTLTWAGPQDRLQEELAELDAAEGDVSLRKLQGYSAGEGPLDALTDRQRQVLEVAFEQGYYDVPRDASVRSVADALDLDDSTVAEHLQRAERNLLGRLLE